MIAFILATSDIWVKMKTAGRQDEASPELNFILHAHLCCYFETRPVPSGLCEGAFCLCGIVESTGIGRVVHFFRQLPYRKPPNQDSTNVVMMRQWVYTKSEPIAPMTSNNRRQRNWNYALCEFEG